METLYSKEKALAVVVNGLIWPSLAVIVSFILFVMTSKNVEL